MNGQFAGIPGGVPGAIAVGSVLACLFGFGLLYNSRVGALKRRKPHYPSSILVVIGVIATSIGIGLLDILTDWPALLINALAFTASGAPMIWGDLERSTNEGQEQARRARKAARQLARHAKQIIEEASDGDETPASAESLE